ncbi:MAG: mechanosensitive ion channel family protein [Myxococcota bacterium]
MPHTRAAGLLLALVLGPLVARASAQDVDCSTPRRAVATWLDNLQEGQEHPGAAASCFAWRAAGVRGAELRERRARQLKRIFDARGAYVDLEALPDTAAPPEENDGRIVIAQRLPEIVLAKAGSEWKVSGESVRAIPGLYADAFDEDVEALLDALPDWAKVAVLPGVELWQLLGLLLALALGWMIRALLAALVANYVGGLIQRAGLAVDVGILATAAKPFGTLVFALFVGWALPLLRFGVRFNQVVDIAVQLLATSMAVLVVYRLVDVGSDIFARRAAETETKLDDQLVPLVRKTTKVFVFVVGLIFVLQNLEVDVASLLAGASLGGLAFTLAAQDTVANLFGSLSIFADQPFQVGDWVVIDGNEGIVEEVGMRSTRIRTFYNSVISLPNRTVANAAVDNYGRREYRRCMVTLGLTYDTTPEQMQAFVEGIRAILKANPHVRQDAYEVHFRNFGDSALEVLLYFFFRVESWTAELRERQNVFLEIIRLAERLKVRFAYPTQTLHVESVAPPGDVPEFPRPSREERAEAVRGFGPGGALATVSTPWVAGGLWPGEPAPDWADEAGDGEG